VITPRKLFLREEDIEKYSPLVTTLHENAAKAYREEVELPSTEGKTRSNQKRKAPISFDLKPHDETKHPQESKPLKSEGSSESEPDRWDHEVVVSEQFADATETSCTDDPEAHEEFPSARIHLPRPGQHRHPPFSAGTSSSSHQPTAFHSPHPPVPSTTSTHTPPSSSRAFNTTPSRTNLTPHQESTLLQPSMFIKYAVGLGKPKSTRVCIIPSADGRGIVQWEATQYELGGKPVFRNKSIHSRQLLVTEITDIKAGKQTKALRRPSARKAPPDNCFSLISSRRTLDLEAANPEAARLWVATLNQLRGLQI